VAQILEEEGFSMAMALQGGLQVWMAAGYPLEK
jgi:rhodanese-related sulfurtransferase